MAVPELNPDHPSQRDGRRWLTLRLARALLGINESTLRNWADQGLVHAFRTPGGHRRFSAEDIYALMERNGRGAPEVHLGGDTRVLPRIRRRLRGSARGHAPAWLAVFDEAGHQRMRVLGREFLELCTDYIDHPDRAEAVPAAGRLGGAYGEELARRDIPLGDALRAFIFFRNATIAAIKPVLLRRGGSPEGVSFALEQLTRLTDEVLLSLASLYGGDLRPRETNGHPSRVIAADKYRHHNEPQGNA